MLSSFPSVIRLMLCLLLSTGVHGGLAFYDWMMGPAESSLVAAPVMVSFLPAAEALPKMTKVLPRDTPVPAPIRKPSRPAPKPKAAAKVQKVKKALVKKPLVPESLNKAPEETASAEMVCTPPRDVVPEVSPVAVEVDADAGEAAEEVVLAALEVVDTQVVSDASSFASRSLVEAIPNYRSNPLPEYPRLARRKHWEGVVWLLVDVSSEGSVDDLEVEQTCGHKLLDRSAERTVKRWQFSPATRAGLPVSSQVRIPVRFRLEEG